MYHCFCFGGFCCFISCLQAGLGIPEKKNRYRVFKHRDLFYYEGGSDSQVARNKLQIHHSQKFLIYLAQVYTQSYNKKITILGGISGSR